METSAFEGEILTAGNLAIKLRFLPLISYS